MTPEDEKKLFELEQQLDIPYKDRYYNKLTDEQISELTCTKGSYEAEQEEKGETDYKALEDKVEELKKRYGKQLL